MSSPAVHADTWKPRDSRSTRAIASVPASSSASLLAERDLLVFSRPPGGSSGTIRDTQTLRAP